MPFTFNLDTFSIDDSTIHVTQLCGFVLCARCAWEQADLSCCSWNILPSACKILTHYPVLCSLHKPSHPYLWAKLLLDSTQLTLQLPTFFFFVLDMKQEQFCQTLEKTPTPSQAHSFLHPCLALAPIYSLQFSGASSLHFSCSTRCQNKWNDHVLSEDDVGIWWRL